MAPHSSTLAWKIPWMEEPGGLKSMWSLRVGHDWVTSLSRIGERNGNPLQCSCLENPRDRGAWWAAVYGVTQSRTRLTRLSSSSLNKSDLVGSRVTSEVKNLPDSAGDVKDTGLIHGWGRVPQRRKWKPTPVFLPGEFHAQRSLVGYSPWGCKEPDTTEAT